MEMENSALTQLIATQTQLIQQIQQTQQQMVQQQSANQISTITPPIKGQTATMSDGAMQMTGVDNSFITNSADLSNPKNTAPPQIFNPTSYASYAAGSMASPTGKMGGDHNLTPQGLFKATISEMRNFDPTKTSKEGADAYLSKQTRGFQEQAVGAVGAIGAAAGTVGGFLVPGILPGLAVGAAIAGTTAYVGGSMMQGATDSLDYQEILRKDGYKAFNAFESTTDFGGVGIKLDERQELSKFMRDLAPEKFMEDEDMQKILTGSLDNKLLKSSTDVESFKKKFKEIVDTVKNITISMDQSIEEATAFMGELERRGIATKDMTLAAGQTKVLSSVLGMDAGQTSQLLLSATDNMTQGTSMDAKKTLDGTAQTMYMGTIIEAQAKVDESSTYDYMKNNGGAAVVSAGVEQSVRDFSKTDSGQQYLLGYMGAAFEKNGEEFTVNHEKLDEMLNGDYSLDDMQQMASENIDQLSDTEKAKLMGSVGSIWNNSTNGTEHFATIGKLRDAFQEETGADAQTALVQMGLAGDYEQADLFNKFIEESQDPDMANRFAARSFKESMDASALAESPTLMKRAEYAFKLGVTNKIGDMGQGISDGVGDFSQDYQKLLTGMEDRGVVGGELLSTYDEAGTEEVFGKNIEDINQHFQKMAEKLETKDGKFNMNDLEALGYAKIGQIEIDKDGKTEVEEFSEGSFKVALNKINEGNFSASDTRKLQDKLEDDELKGQSFWRADYAVNKANGEYDGVMGNMSQISANIAMTTMDVGAGLWNGAKEGGQAVKGMFTDSNNTKEALESSAEMIKKSSKDLGKEMKKIFSEEKDLGVSEDEYTELEGYIKMGDTEKVKDMTSNKKVRELAEKYKEHGINETEYGTAATAFTDLTRETEGMGRLGKQMSDFVSASGAFSEEETQALFKDMKKDGKNIREDIGDMTADDMFKARKETLAQGAEIFENMTQHDMTKIARSAADQNKGDKVTMDSFFIEGSEVIDSEKLFNVISNDIIRQTNASEKKVKKDEDGNGDAKKTADGHKKAMSEMLEALQEETAEIRRATSDMKNERNKTSIGG